MDLSEKDTGKCSSVYFQQAVAKHVFTGLSKKSSRQLQLILNAAARVLTNTEKVEHITLLLKSLDFSASCVSEDRFQNPITCL